ncbi:MAG TPA: MATE family efflux transporter [Bacteroidales bacterium]|nr:MATE family efflux transporter [Bacteroidales bacterium]
MGEKVNLTTGNIGTTLTKLAIPIMGTSFVQMTYNITDMFWVGNLGSDSLAAVGTAGFFSWFAFSLILLSKIGAEVFVAQHLGRNDEEGAQNYARSAIHLNLMLAAGYGLMLLLLREHLIAFFNLGDANVIEMAVGYLTIVASGILFMFINPVLTSIFNGSGNSKTPFMINLTGLAMNMILDPVLIRGLGPVPALGVYGAAYATIFSQLLVTGIFIFIMTTSKDPFFKINIFRKVDLFRIKKIIKLGFPVGIQNGLFSMIAMVIARIISIYGPGAIAAQKLGSQIESITWMTASGYSTAISAFVGQNYGAQKYQRIMKGYASGLRLMSMIGIATTFLLYIFAEQLFGIFVSEQETIAMGTSYLMIIALSQWFSTLEISNQGAFNGLGKTLYPSIVGIIFNILRIPMAYYFSRDLGLGLDGVWWAITVSSMFKGVILFAFFYFIVIRKYRKTGTI